MLAFQSIRSLSCTVMDSLRRQRKHPADQRRLRLEELEERCVPTVTAVNETFNTTPNTPTALNVLSPATTASGERLSLVSVGAVSPSGPTLTQNADGSLTFQSAAAGQYSFNYTPTGTQQQVTATDGDSFDNFGYSVAVDGNFAVVGAPSHQVGSNAGQGAVYVFVQVDNTWLLYQELHAGDGKADDAFGSSVAISGNTIVVGANGHQVGGNSSQGAAYVFQFNGTTWSQQQELIAGDGNAFDSFGGSVAISGNTVVVGAEYRTVNSNANQGTVYVFTGSGAIWTQQQELTVSDGAANDKFGSSVAVSGNTVVVGAKDHQVGSHADQGAAYVFLSNGATWSQQQELTAGNGAVNDEFGTSVAISGNTAVIGASLHKVGSNSDQGAAYVFTRTGSTWNQPQELTASDGGAGDGFGISVSINGNALVVGAYGHKVGSNGGEGSAYVFTLAGTTWSQQQELTASDGVADDAIGYGAAVSSSGAVVIGAFNHEVGSNSGQGAAYFQNVTATPGTVTVDVTSQNVTAVNDNVTTTPGTATNLNVLANDSNPQGNGLQIASVGAVSPSGPTLTQNANGTLTFSSAATGTYNFNYTATGQQQEVTASDGAAEDAEGVSVAITGMTAVVGAFGRDGNQGVAYVYALSGSTWSLQAELTAADGATGDAFGYSVAIDGNTIVVGAQNHKVSGNAQGAAYVFARSGTTWSLQQELTAGDGALGDQFGESVSVSGATIVVGAEEHKVGSNAMQGAAYVYTLTGTTWTQQQELTASDGKANDLFGDSVAVFGDTLVVGAYGHKVNSNAEQGAAYVFTRSGASWSQQQELTASDGAAQDYFGTSVAISGNTIVVGADDHMVGSHLAQGAAYVFSRSGPTWIQDQEITSSDGEKDDVFGESVSISGTTILVGAGEHSLGSHLNAGAAYVFTFNGSTWSQQQELTANDEAAGNEFGETVALSGDMVVIGSPTKMVGSHQLQGAAYFQNASVSQAAVIVMVTTPAVVTATSGGGQSVPENTAFASPLIVSVTDAKGNPVPGVLVTFAAPGSGAGATFGGGNTATTNAQGQASINPTANGRGGSYTITASVSGVAAPANFDLTNIYSTVPPPPGTNPSPNASPATVGVFNSATATWYLNGSNSSGPPTVGEFQYGAPGWIGLVGDFTGDGQTTVVVVDPSTETWYIRNSNSAGAPSITPFQFGEPGWIPVVGDWNGSGIDGIGVVDPTTGNWYLRNEASAGAPDAGVFSFGEAGWIPLVGNWAGNANGQDGIGMLNPTTEMWYLRNTPNAGGVNYTPFSYGAPGWTPVVGAWTGSAQTGIGVYDPTGTFYLRNELSGGAPDAGHFSYGVGGWTPLAGQWQNPSDPGQNQFAAGVGPGAPALSNAALQSTVQEALALLRTDGVAPALVQELASATYTVADLPPGLLGETFVQTNTVEISADASGYGWYTDTTADDPAYVTNGTAAVGSLAANHQDLLTTILHEMGHLAGQPDVVNATTGSNLMDAILPLGTRRIDALDLVFASGVFA